ncbi:hypothetical protein ACFE04_012887 [Oxalis oulophora]
MSGANRGIKRKSTMLEMASRWGKMTARELNVSAGSLEIMVAHTTREVAWVNKQLKHLTDDLKLLMKRILYWCDDEMLARIMMRSNVPTKAFVIYQEVIAEREMERLRKTEFYTDCGNTNPLEDPSDDVDSSEDLSG